MHSRIIKNGDTPTLLYLESLSCFMTVSIESKIRKILLFLGYPVESMPIRSAAITLFPQQLCDTETDKEKNAIQKSFQNSILGQYLQENINIWVACTDNT